MTQTFTYKSHEPTTLVNFIADELAISHSKAKQILDTRRVFVNRKRVWMTKHELKKGDKVLVPKDQEQPQTQQTATILYEDRHYLIADKPPNLITNGPRSFETQLKRLTGATELQAIHRLDKQTSGCLIFAKSQKAADAIIALFKERRVRKTYRAIVSGRPQQQKMTIRTALDGKEALSSVKLLKTGHGVSFLEIQIETGRTHQIRRHLASKRLPVLGDTHYGNRKTAHADAMNVPRHMLHAWKIGFTCPLTRKRIQAASPYPPDFKNCLTQFFKPNRGGDR